MADCPDYVEDCTQCGLPRKRWGEHDCFEALKESLAKNTKECSKIEAFLGVDYDVLKPTCPRYHPMKRRRGKLFEGNGRGTCTKCGENDLMMHEYYYDCRECNTQLCRACVLLQAKLILKECRFMPHKSCIMTKQGANRRASWACDARKLKPDSKGCVSGCEGFGQQVKYLQSWRCSECDFDLCIACCLEYGVFDPSTIKTIMG